MQQQWNMMKNITKRYRSLGMTSQLPAFVLFLPAFNNGSSANERICARGDDRD